MVEVGGLLSFIKRTGLAQTHDSDGSSGDFSRRDRDDQVRVSVVVPRITIVVFKRRDFRIELTRTVFLETIREGVCLGV